MKQTHYFLIFIKLISRQIVAVRKHEDILFSNKQIDYLQIDMNSYERLKERMVDYSLDMPREKIMMDLQLDEFLI
jgi:hypothetical protein